MNLEPMKTQGQGQGLRNPRPPPVFSLMGRFQKVIDTGGRVFKPLECAILDVMGNPRRYQGSASVRVRSSLPRSIKSPRPAFAEAATRRQV